MRNVREDGRRMVSWPVAIADRGLRDSIGSDLGRVQPWAYKSATLRSSARRRSLSGIGRKPLTSRVAELVDRLAHFLPLRVVGRIR
jgi:hypothetical protein